jgi:arsenate reductase
VLVGRLAEELGLRQPTVSHHVKALLEEGLLQREPEGRRTWYSLAPAHADRVAEMLGGPPAQTAVEPILDRVVRDLSERFQGVFGRETVERYVRASYELLAARPTPDKHVPSLAARPWSWMVAGGRKVSTGRGIGITTETRGSDAILRAFRRWRRVIT